MIFKVLVRMRAILLDIEGTTTPISFVYDVLFPYARARMKDYVQAAIGSDAFAPIFEALQQESVKERAAGEDAPSLDQAQNEASHAAVVANFALWLMDHDRKSTPLKEIQGQLWQRGYEQGQIEGVVYPDVVDAMRRWNDAGHTVAIYSSGSVQAQKLIFGFSDAGDLRPLIRAYFDTTTGPKKERESYTLIAQSLDIPTQDILFLSDNPYELAAARDAGLKVRLAVRPGNAPVQTDAYTRVSDFTVDSIGF